MIYSDVHLGQTDIAQYEAALHEETAQRDYEKTYSNLSDEQERLVHRTVQEYLYQSLDSIDQKAGGLLTANSVIFALYFFIFDGSISFYGQIPFAIGLALSLIALLACLSVFDIYWPTASDLKEANLNGINQKYIRTRNIRTILVRLSKTCVFLSVIFLSMYLLLSLVIMNALN